MPEFTNKTVLKNFPKVELHRHLEGTFETKTLFRIAKRNGIDVPADYDSFKQFVQFPKNSKPDFQLFLSKFKNDWYRSHDDIFEIVYESVKDFKDDGLFYIELRFSPEHFALQNNFDRKDVVQLVIEAGNQAAADIDMKIKYLVTFNRGKQDQKDMISLYKMLTSLNQPDIVGIDLAGDEQNFPISLFSDFFQTISRDGLYQTTIHAGEVTPSSEIWSAIKLKASRIGHGTSTIHDPELQKVLKDRSIALEQCITSNYQTGSWVDEKHHPLGSLYGLGVPVTINSDDPTIQDTDLTDDYLKAVSYFDLSLKDLIALNLTAIKSSFLPETEKKKLKADYLRAVDTFKTQNAAEHSKLRT